MRLCPVTAAVRCRPTGRRAVSDTRWLVSLAGLISPPNKAGTTHVTESVTFKKSSALLDIMSPSPSSFCVLAPRTSFPWRPARLTPPKRPCEGRKSNYPYQRSAIFRHSMHFSATLTLKLLPSAYFLLCHFFLHTLKTTRTASSVPVGRCGPAPFSFVMFFFSPVLSLLTFHKQHWLQWYTKRQSWFPPTPPPCHLWSTAR